MPSKYQEYRQMADTAERRFTSSYKSWTQFLRTAARLYKYPYNEQVMPRPKISTPATARPGIPRNTTIRMRATSSSTRPRRRRLMLLR